MPMDLPQGRPQQQMGLGPPPVGDRRVLGPPAPPGRAGLASLMYGPSANIQGPQGGPRQAGPSAPAPGDTRLAQLMYGVDQRDTQRQPPPAPPPMPSGPPLPTGAMGRPHPNYGAAMYGGSSAPGYTGNDPAARGAAYSGWRPPAPRPPVVLPPNTSASVGPFGVGGGPPPAPPQRPPQRPSVYNTPEGQMVWDPATNTARPLGPRPY